MGFDRDSALKGAANYDSIRLAIYGLLADRVVTTDMCDNELDKTESSGID